MNLQEQRTLDDWFAAKKRIATELQADTFLQGLVDEYMRDEVPEGGRLRWADKVVDAAKEKDSPGGWLRVCIENGTLDKALFAVGAAEKRREKRENFGQGKSKYDCRQALRRAYEARNGDINSGTRKLDSDGGLPWAVIVEEDKALEAMLRNELERLQGFDAYVQDGYQMWPRVTFSLLTEAANNVADSLDSHNAQARDLNMGDIRRRTTVTELEI